jgi:hypothetical protein
VLLCQCPIRLSWAEEWIPADLNALGPGNPAWRRCRLVPWHAASSVQNGCACASAKERLPRSRLIRLLDLERQLLFRNFICIPPPGGNRNCFDNESSFGSKQFRRAYLSPDPFLLRDDGRVWLVYPAIHNSPGSQHAYALPATDLKRTR